MQESYGEGLAAHAGPESCAVDREVGGEALTGESVSRAIEPRNVPYFRVPASYGDAWATRGWIVSGEIPPDLARSKTLCVRGHTSRGKREIPSLAGE